MKVILGFKKLNETATIPTKNIPTDSGFDLYASEDVIIEPGETKVIPTGIAIQLPRDTEAQVRPRSGVTSKTKLRVQLGTIDNEYTGEIGVIVDNIAEGKYRLGKDWYALGIDNKSIETCNHFWFKSYHIRKGDRIAQLVIQPLPSVEVYEVEGDLKETDRGEGGFGSSGVREREQMSDYDELIGKKAYKISGGLYGNLIGIIERSDRGITPLRLHLPDGTLLGAFPQDLNIVKEDE